MTILNFLKRKPKHTAPPKTAYGPKIVKQLDALSSIVRRIELTQQETVLQLEEIDAAINDDTGKTVLPIIEIADIVYDFYYFARNDDALKSQAQMMWSNAKKCLRSAGIDILEPTGEQFNYSLHIAHDTVSYANIPHEVIAATLKVGYIQDATILRRATVIVNKHTQEV